jgi:hypothetical protein
VWLKAVPDGGLGTVAVLEWEHEHDNECCRMEDHRLTLMRLLGLAAQAARPVATSHSSVKFQFQPWYRFVVAWYTSRPGLEKGAARL